MATELGKKSRWATEAIKPANEMLHTTVRGLVDLPTDVTPGARQVAQLTAWRSVQSYALQPIVHALEELQRLNDWSSGFLVADSVRFDWKTAPIRHYTSFEDFYQKELEQTWGEWASLQEIYRRFANGDINLDQAQSLMRRGAPLGNQNAAKIKEENKGSNRTFVSRGDNPEYWQARLERDHPKIAEQLARGEFRSARAAAVAAGIVIPPTPLDVLRKEWKKASAQERAAFLAEIGSE